MNVFLSFLVGIFGPLYTANELISATRKSSTSSGPDDVPTTPQTTEAETETTSVTTTDETVVLSDTQRQTPDVEERLPEPTPDVQNAVESPAERTPNVEESVPHVPAAPDQVVIVSDQPIAPTVEPDASKTEADVVRPAAQNVTSETGKDATLLEAGTVTAPKQPDTATTSTSNNGTIVSDTGTTIEVISGRVTTLDPIGDDIASVRVVDGPEHGNLTVNPDNTLALVLTQTDYTGPLSISYEVTNGDGSTSVVQASLEAKAGPIENGWGLGQHYVLETNASDETVIEWGDNHRDVYMSGSSKALTIADIAAREGVPVSKISKYFLLDNPEYGSSPDMALAQDAGNMLWDALVRESFMSEPSSNWLRLEAGYEYELGQNAFVGLRGESELHPTHITSYGDGAKPVITNAIFSIAEGSENLVISDVEFEDGVQFLSGKNIIFENVSSNSKFVTQFTSGVTVRNSSFTDAIHDTSLSEGYWEPFANRISGLYAGNTDGLLLENNFFDHNGWAEGYDPELSLDSPMPPSILNHNIYLATSNLDATIRDNVSMRAASFGAQIRSGGYVEDNVFIDNNASFYVAGGEQTVNGDKVYLGNYSLVTDNITTSGQHLLYGPKNGYTAAGVGNLAPLTSLVDNIIAHLADPNNPDELAEKYQINFAINHNNQAYADDTIVYNWAGANDAKDLFDENTAGLNAQVLDQTTIQNFAAQILSDPTATIDDLGDYLKSVAQAGHIDADQIINFFQSGFGIVLDERLIAETLRFSPNDLGAGVRWDNRLNWSTEDLPGTALGDSVNLAGNWVEYGGTTTLNNLHMGDAGRLSLGQGRLNVEGQITTDGSDSQITIDNAGQLWVENYTDTNNIGIDIDGGRFANTGEITGKFQMDITDGQAILATDGATFNVGAGSSLNIIGGSAQVGFDGTTGDIAILRMQEGGTLKFAAEDNIFGTIEEFRSGANGELETDVASGLNMNGGTLGLDLSAPGYDLGSRHTLISVDELVGRFDAINVTGLAPNRDAQLTVDYIRDTIDIKITGSGTGAFDLDMIGNQTNAQTNSDLWEALTSGQPIIDDTVRPETITLTVNDDLIEL